MKEKKLRSIIINSIVMIVFWILAVVFTVLQRNIFFLINFGYIGTALGAGLILYTVLPRAKKHLGRKMSQFLVGLYLFAFLGVFAKMNIQIEGVWLELLFGVATAPLIHYLIAKIIGPLVFGRVYCGWACWTAMILDLLPFSKSRGRLRGPWGHLRYVHFILSLVIVLGAWFLAGYSQFVYFTDSSNPGMTAYISTYSVIWFLAGNVSYYLLGIILAFACRDNRAFCKYVCPVTAFLKAGTRFALVKIRGKADDCTGCGTCVKACPMDINIPAYIQKGKRVTSSECIFCLTCTNSCPQQVLKASVGFDGGFKERLKFREGAAG